MRRRFSKSTRKTGLPPGSLVPAHPERTEKVNIVLTRCDDGGCLEKKPQSAKELFPLQPGGVNWIDIDGIHDIELIREIGEGFGLHPLFLEDIATTGQNPKVEDFGAYIFLVLKALSFNEMTGEIDAEQVSIVFGENYVISFREHPTPLFNAIRGRIGASSARFLKMGADYLAYSLFDVVVDNYFVVLEKYGDSVEAAEEALLNHPRPGTLQSIYRLKREALFLRRSVWLARDTMNFLYLSESALIKQPTRVYIRDVYEHIVQVIDTAENYREMVFGMLDIYLSSVSYRLNEVMKVLTIISTIFIPLTFLVGVYGMNFEYMPELKKHWAYPTLWAVMVALALGMVAYFKKKKWF